MRTIENCEFYKFNNNQKRSLRKRNIVNWCWWKKGFKFEYLFWLIKWIIWKYNKTKAKKLKKLFKDFQKLCNYQHDIDFYLWWTWKDFFEANDIFIDWIMKLLHWMNPFLRFFIKSILFLWLNTIWIIYFNFRKERADFYLLFTNLY